MRKTSLVVCLALVALLHNPITYALQTTSSIQTGYIRLVPDAGMSSPAGVAIFGQRSDGVLITEAGVPSTTASQSGRIFADIGGSVNTGIAMANPNDKDVTVSFYFTDGSGNDFGA